MNSFYQAMQGGKQYEHKEDFRGGTDWEHIG